MMAGTSESSTNKSDEEDNVSSIEIRTTTNDGIPIKKLSVGNLPIKVTNGELKEIFSVYGKVQCIYPSKRYKGCFTLITYADVNHALKARLAANKKELICRGRVLNVEPVTSNEQPGLMRAAEKQKIRRQIKIQKAKNKKSPKPTLNILDDDCLIKIFLYLSVSDRLRIERVCKRWQTVNLQSWSNIKDLKLDAHSFVAAEYAKPNRMNDRAVQKVLFRCGRFLNTLKVNSSELDCTSKVISIIAQHCHNLTFLSLYMDKYPNKELLRLFHNTKKLSVLKLYDLGNGFDGSCLRNLPADSITEISLHAKSKDESFTTSFRYFGHNGATSIKKLIKLRKLKMDGYTLLPDRLKAIAYNNTITHLTLAHCSFKKGGLHIANLTGLTYLDVANVVEINDSFIQKLADSCPHLQYLNISWCISVTNAGINAIAKLKGLETLKIGNLYDVSGTVIRQLRNLKVLHCQNCNSICDDSVADLIKNAPHLEELNLCDTMISTATLDTAYHVTINRSNPIPLRIVVNSTLKDEWESPPDMSSSVLIIQTERGWEPDYAGSSSSGDDYDHYDDLDEDDYDSDDCWQSDDFYDLDFIHMDEYARIF